MIAEVVREERMPPWHANPQYGHFANDNRLSAEEKELIADLGEKRLPAGRSAATCPSRASFTTAGSCRASRTRLFYMTEQPVDVKAEGVESYRHYMVDPGFTEDKWVKLAECMPGNRAVVHHIIVYIKPPGAGRRRGRRSADRDVRGLRLSGRLRPGHAAAGFARRLGEENSRRVEARVRDALHADRHAAAGPQQRRLDLRRTRRK